eukprot:scaffold100060_cov75-Phaeocystis_antarctica.AAC.1
MGRAAARPCVARDATRAWSSWRCSVTTAASARCARVASARLSSSLARSTATSVSASHARRELAALLSGVESRGLSLFSAPLAGIAVEGRAPFDGRAAECGYCCWSKASRVACSACPSILASILVSASCSAAACSPEASATRSASPLRSSAAWRAARSPRSSPSSVERHSFRKSTCACVRHSA